MSARFDLEQNILDCWKVTDDIDLLYTSIMDNNYADMTVDTIANALLGMKVMYDLKFNKTWESFEKTLEEMREAKNAGI